MADRGDFWDRLDPKYRLILCDLWGVVHDGRRLHDGAAERLQGWRRQGRAVFLITNAPRPASTVEAHLSRLGLPENSWDGLVTSGEAGIAALKQLDTPVGFLGTAPDRADLENGGVRIANSQAFTDVVCTGLEPRRPEVSDYRAGLERWAGAGVRMHCLNPDRLVIHGGVPMVCAGAIADAYELLGGEVSWYGKPYPAIYDHALRLAGDPPRNTVLAIGDGLQTDMLGAARMSFDAVFVDSGLHRGEAFPATFACDHQLGEWQPLAVVDSLR